mgnify:CR=1 FL=1|tara:strand:+ start:106 stop:312 length:207 start_codon:yes stop_codon:yes gene_type:complete
MAKFKLTFYGTEKSGTHIDEIECFLNVENDIFIKIGSSDSYEFICLDKSTAIKFAKTLRTEINKITEL